MEASERGNHGECKQNKKKRFRKLKQPHNLQDECVRNVLNKLLAPVSNALRTSPSLQALRSITPNNRPTTKLTSGPMCRECLLHRGHGNPLVFEHTPLVANAAFPLNKRLICAVATAVTRTHNDQWPCAQVCMFLLLEVFCCGGWFHINRYFHGCATSKLPRLRVDLNAIPWESMDYGQVSNDNLAYRIVSHKYGCTADCVKCGQAFGLDEPFVHAARQIYLLRTQFLQWLNPETRDTSAFLQTVAYCVRTAKKCNEAATFMGRVGTKGYLSEPFFVCVDAAGPYGDQTLDAVNMVDFNASGLYRNQPWPLKNGSTGMGVVLSGRKRGRDERERKTGTQNAPSGANAGDGSLSIDQIHKSVYDERGCFRNPFGNLRFTIPIDDVLNMDKAPCDNPQCSDNTRTDSGLTSRPQYHIYCRKCLNAVGHASQRLVAREYRLPVQVDILVHRGENLRRASGVHACVMYPQQARHIAFGEHDCFDIKRQCDVQEWRGKCAHFSDKACCQTGIPQYDPNTTVVLFPAPGSFLAREYASKDPDTVRAVQQMYPGFDMRKLRTLVVVEARWSGASQVLRHPHLRNVPKLKLGDYHTYYWRSQNHGSRFLATIEAIYYAVRELGVAMGHTTLSEATDGFRNKLNDALNWQSPYDDMMVIYAAYYQRIMGKLSGEGKK